MLVVFYSTRVAINRNYLLLRNSKQQHQQQHGRSQVLHRQDYNRTSSAYNDSKNHYRMTETVDDGKVSSGNGYQRSTPATIIIWEQENVTHPNLGAPFSGIGFRRVEINNRETIYN
jgi:hypothetical protein